MINSPRLTPLCLLLAATSACYAPSSGDDPEAHNDSLTNFGKYNFKVMLLNGGCMDVAGGSTSSGAQIQEWTCNGTGAQVFQAQALDSTYYKLVNPQSGKCLDVYGGQTADGTKIELWSCNGGANQAFRLASSNGYYKIIGKQSNKCVDVSGAQVADGTKVQLWTCNGTWAQLWNPVAPGTTSGGTTSSGGTSGGTTTTTTGGIAGVVSSSLFDQLFPNRNSFYSYSGLTSTSSTYSAFANESDSTIRKREAAAFLANVALETGELVYIEEIIKSGNYCDPSSCGGCPAGTFAYYGRGPLQLSWNCNYAAAGQAIGADLLDSPGLLATNSSLSWKSAAWFWMTQPGANTMTAHAGITCTDSWCGFGQTIRSINGARECDGGDPAAVQSRINYYKHFCDLLGVSYGPNLSC